MRYIGRLSLRDPSLKIKFNLNACIWLILEIWLVLVIGDSPFVWLRKTRAGASRQSQGNRMSGFSFTFFFSLFFFDTHTDFIISLWSIPCLALNFIFVLFSVPDYLQFLTSPKYIIWSIFFIMCHVTMPNLFRNHNISKLVKWLLQLFWHWRLLFFSLSIVSNFFSLLKPPIYRSSLLLSFILDLLSSSTCLHCSVKWCLHNFHSIFAYKS